MANCNMDLIEDIYDNPIIVWNAIHAMFNSFCLGIKSFILTSYPFFYSF